jgi:uncharacterized oxidoreductase
VLCELLGGSLTGCGATEPRDVVVNGMLSFYIDPKVVDPANFFAPDMARYIGYLKSSRPTAPGGEVLIPGEPEARNRAQRSKDGIPLPESTWAALVAVAREVGVVPPNSAAAQLG